jgi:hypothetical protein
MAFFQKTRLFLRLCNIFTKKGLRVFCVGIRSPSTGTEEVQVTGNWVTEVVWFLGVSERIESGLRLKD